MRTAAAILPAFLLEAAFYLVLGIESVRTQVERSLSPAAAATLLALSALAPYCLYTIALGVFHWNAFWSLAALVIAASFWYVVLPHLPALDILFIALMALVYLLKFFKTAYPSPIPRLHLDVLGHLMWIRAGAFALLSIRQVKGVGFGFIPSRKDWYIGVLYYLLFLPVGAAVAFAIHYAAYRPLPLAWWKISLIAVGSFLGILWVVALSEEFVFRGLLQQWFSSWFHSDVAGLLFASALFGLVHLFNKFPNWRYAVMTALLGVFCGAAFRHGKGIRAAMVTHALAATTARVLFS